MELDESLTFEGQMVSYAQYGEDVVLRRAFPNQTTGFYVDIGAHDPIVDSVTQHFYLSGWRGVNVEPLTVGYQHLVRRRPEDVNVQAAVSNRAENIRFFEIPSAPGLSTTNPALASQYRAEGRVVVERLIPAVTLADIFKTCCGDRVVDFLKIDVEGHELEVLEGADFARFRPRVLLIESGWKPEQWHEHVVSAAYLFASEDVCNRYYVRKEDAELLPALQLPANARDRYISFPHARALVAERQWNSVGPMIQRFALRAAALKDRHANLKHGLKGVVRRFAPSLLSRPGRP